MNKVALILIVAAVLVAGGIIYAVVSNTPDTVVRPPAAVPVEEAPQVIVTRELRVPVTLTRTLFNPATVAAQQGDMLELVITSADGAHSIYIPSQDETVSFEAMEEKSVKVAVGTTDIEIVCNVNCRNGNILTIDVQ